MGNNQVCAYAGAGTNCWAGPVGLYFSKSLMGGMIWKQRVAVSLLAGLLPAFVQSLLPSRCLPQWVAALWQDPAAVPA